MPAKRKKTATKQKTKKVTGKKKVSSKKPVKKAVSKSSKKKKTPAKKKSAARKPILKASKVKNKLKSKKVPKKLPKTAKKIPAKAEYTKKVVKKTTPAKTSKTGKKARLMAVTKKMDPALLKIREELISERSDLLRMIASSQEIERNVGDISFSNEIDLASSLEGREMAFQLSSRERNELKLMDETLYKMSTGSYGICEGCSKKIGLKRLQIMPLTSLCIDCQESAENS